MTDRPIIFSAPMVRALLAGAKTQTRRVLKQPDEVGLAERVPPLRFAVGDRLWVRETWRTFVSLDGIKPSNLWVPGERGAGVCYEADHSGLGLTKEGGRTYGPREMNTGAFGKLRTSMFMPRWASRLTLHVTDVRVQRLHETSEADAIAEGVEMLARAPGLLDGWTDYIEFGIQQPSAFGSYRTLWCSINGAGSWDANPWVIALTFNVERANIGQARAA